MNIDAQLNLAYIKVKRLLKKMTIEQIINYITQNKLIDMTCVDEFNAEQYSQLFGTIMNFCKHVDTKNSCLVGSIIYANIMSYFGVSVKLNIGMVLYDGARHAHAWIDIIDISPMEIICIVKSYSVRPFAEQKSN